ncbi:MAG: ATP-dependent DNA ligase [Ekhidna sp.]|nr:ATP-dependent DNA ligase [Ekhidna sp.]MBC6424951.1 ATP-dependent DNA ligase [Ekhidna sp.]
MRRFARLFEELDQTTKTNDRIRSLVSYLEDAEEEDKLWSVALLSGKRPKRGVNSTRMKEWAAEEAGIPFWLFEESYQVVGDMAETISLVLPFREGNNNDSLTDWMEKIIAIAGEEEEVKRQFVVNSWKELRKKERLIFNKLIGGSFRIGVSQKTMVRALSKHSGKGVSELAHRLTGQWSPQTHTYHSLIEEGAGDEDLSKPYPFYLAYPLDEKSDFNAKPEEWYAERKWDGIRGQLISRGGEVFVWTRGEELVTEKYPELMALRQFLPEGVVLDGEILSYKDRLPLPFSELQRRIGRKNVGKKLLCDVPIIMVAYDLLEYNGKDLRASSLLERRTILEKVVSAVNHPNLHISRLLEFKNKNDLAKIRQESRQHRTEGLMLKRKNSEYKVGRKRGDWWKWKVDPLVIDAVMIYAMRGHGRRANLYTDYTFAVWNNKELVPFTKAYSGLTDDEFRQVDRFVKANILEKFGPVRSVRPELVFEIAFEGIAKSTHHKSGISLRFPRMNRWRQDKKPEEANTLTDLKEMLSIYG